MTNGKFETKSEAVRFAANRVAQAWLAFADKVIARGETPTAFSKPDDMGCPLGRMMAREELDSDIYNRFRYCMSSADIFSYAKQEARERLQSGEFPRVAAFDFTPQLQRAA